jgi:branched-chain amino acid aminotransferase
MDIANLNQNILIYVNGELLPRSEAVISVYDSGFLMGDGVWEGIRLIQDKWIFLDEHIDRLFEGARAIDLELELSAEQITNAIFETQHANNMSDQAHARVMFTRGVKVKPFQQPALSASGPTFVIIMEHSDPHAKAQGITIATVPQIRGMPMSQDPKLNSHSKLNCILACIQANKMGADEALMLDPHGFVNTTNSCNFFIVKNGEVWTSTGDYCMNGITRKKIIMLCKDNSIPVFEKNFSLVDVYSADEVFITGTLGSLVPVLELDKRTFDAKNNKLTQTLQSLYNDLIHSQ